MNASSRPTARSIQIPDWIKNRISIDTRSLGAFRIIAGLLIIVDAVLRARDFTKFYTEQSVLPLDVRHELYGTQISLFLLSEDPAVTAVLFAIYFLLGVLLLIGYYSRVTTVLAFAFVISLDIRNPMVASYADVLFRFLLFWGMFMPLGERYSIDALRRERDPKPVYSGVAAPFALLQMVFMYFINGTHKFQDYFGEWLSGESMTMIFHYDSVTFLLGPHLAEFESLLRIGGIYWFILMLASPLLLVFVGRLRYLFASLYVFGHIALALTVRIGAFPFVAPMGLLLFCQRTAWQDAQNIADRLTLPTEQMSNKGRQIGSTLDKLLPEFNLGRLSIGIEDETKKEEIRAVASAFLVAFILIMGGGVVMQNMQGIAGMDDEPIHEAQEDLEVIMGTLMISQPDWMFYPGPVESDRYLVVAAETEDGDRLDVYNNREIRFDRPDGKHNHRQLDSYRHRFFMDTLQATGRDNPNNHSLFDAHADYICQTALEEEGSELTTLNMWMIKEEYTIDNVGDRDSYNRTALPLNFYDCTGDDPVLLEEPPMELAANVSLPPEGDNAEV